MSTASRRSSDRPSLFAIGTLIAETYDIRSILGAGGMGQVFDAYDRGLLRRVAIKANYPDVDLQHVSIRNEAQALAAIRHPGVVGVYAFGNHQGTDYMVMEHVSGVTLSKHLARLEKSGFPMIERLDILLAIADGLAAVHRAGISHGDVKPENVLLSATGRVVLTDLGLVRAAYDKEEGLIAGTPAYMAPEIVMSRYVPAGRHLVDVYAFGVLAFRMLSGKHPFQAATEIDMILDHAEEPVPALSDVVEVPKHLSELVVKLMAKDPNDRPQVMDAVVWQLRNVRDELAKTVTDKPTSALSVLVVDDDPDIARLVAMYVKRAAPEADVVLAQDADEALASFRKRPPRLVFLDLNMPKMSGFELFTYLRGVRLVDASTVIAMSAGGSQYDVDLMLELGAQDFIPKGPDLRKRVEQITSMLARGDASVGKENR